MILSKRQTASCVHNALEYAFDGQGRLRMKRFTQEQTADYALDSDQYPIRCRANANVTLSFMTDADWFSFSYDAQTGSSRSFYGIDLFVDQALHDARIIEGFESNDILFGLPGGLHRVTVFLPWSAELMIKTMSLPDGASFQPVPEKRKRILAIGDSITQGYIARHPGFTWTGKLTRALDAEVLNLGVGGYGFYTNSLNHPTAWRADMIILAYGTNDYVREPTPESFRQCAAAYTAKLAAVFPDIPILQVMPIFRNDKEHFSREMSRDYTLEDARQILRDIAAQFPQITLLEDTFYPHGADFFAPDGVHPNDLGFSVLGEEIIRAVLGMDCMR